MHYLTWDTGIIAALALLLAYSLLVRKHKSLATLVSVYVGYFIASIWGVTVSQFLHGDRVFGQLWINANVTTFTVQSVLLVAIAFLISSTIKLGGRRARYSMVEVAVYAVATMAVGISFILSFMTPEMRDSVMASSKIVPYIYQWRQWLTVLPAFAIVFFGLYGNEEG